MLISTLMSFLGALFLWVITKDISLPSESRTIAIISSIPMVAMYASYFYLLQTYPVHQVAPLFQISTIWLLLFELLSGNSITLISLLGITILMYGAYVLDAGTFKWKIPTQLLFIAIPATSTWSISLYLSRLASQTSSPVLVAFWQLLAIGLVGVVLFIFVKRYREGFLYRIKNQGKAFLGLSMINETLAEVGYVFSNLAVATAPIATFVSALSGVQSIFVLLLFFLFPMGKRAKVTKIQWTAVILITIGVFIIEQQ